jgi:uncharacterized membrane protein
MNNPNSRLEAFCDGVFAIAATLLIIEIKVPSIDNIHSKEELTRAFLHSWPSWLAFLISFITILISWINHAHFFRLIDKTSAKFFYANGLLLLAIIILPFPTAAVAEFIETEYPQPAVTFYCLIALLNNIGWLLIMYNLYKPTPLFKEGVNMKQVNQSKRFVYYGTVFYLACTVLSFWFPITAFVLIGLSFTAWLILGITIEQPE